MTPLEAPLQIEQPACEIGAHGGSASTHFYSWEFVFPNGIAVIQPELTEKEIIQLAESSGSFSFLDSAEEDVYNDLLKTKDE